MAKVQHLVNVSGGKDSTAVYLRAIELGGPFRAVFADTGNEDQRVHDWSPSRHREAERSHA